MKRTIVIALLTLSLSASARADETPPLPGYLDRWSDFEISKTCYPAPEGEITKWICVLQGFNPKPKPPAPAPARPRRRTRR